MLHQKTPVQALFIALEKYSLCIFNYTKLPKIMSDSLFRCFAQRNECDLGMLYCGLRMLADDSLKKSTKLTFQMLDLDGDYFISRRECDTMLSNSVANPALIREQTFSESNQERQIEQAVQQLFCDKECISEQEYYVLALQGQNQVHTLLWNFIRDRFNICEHLSSLIATKSAEIDETRLCQMPTQVSISMKNNSRCEGYLYLSSQDEKSERFYRLMNGVILEYRSESDSDYRSLRYIGHDAFLLESKVKQSGFFKFSIKSGSDILTYFTKSQEQHNIWVEAIQLAIGKHKRNISYEYILQRPDSRKSREARSLKDGATVVIQSIEKEGLKFEDLKQIREQIQIEQICKNQASSFKTYFQDSQAIHLVFKSIQRTTLRQYYHQQQHHVKYSEVRGMCVQLCSALAFLKKHSILHRNINPASIFLTGETKLIYDKYEKCEVNIPQIQLGDFSSATFLMPQEYATKVCGLVSFVAPEVFQFHRYSYPADMYSLGTTIYYILTGKVPIFDPDMNRLYWKIINDYPEFEVDFMLSAPADLVQIVAALVIKSAKQRLSIQEVQTSLQEEQRFVKIRTINQRV